MNKSFVIKLTERELCDILMAMDNHINHYDVSKEGGRTSFEYYYLNWINRIRTLFARLQEISPSERGDDESVQTEIKIREKEK